MLAFYDDELNPFGSDPLRSFHTSGQQNIWEKLIYIKNSDAGKYYTGLILQIVLKRYEDVGEYGTTGWSVKFIYGQRRPTEAEWALIRPGEGLVLPDIGSAAAADTGTYHPVWIRVVAPFDAQADIRDNQKLRLYFVENLVGA